MMILSTLGRYIRRIFGFDDDHNARIARGEPHPIGAGGGHIWIGCDRRYSTICYLITDGPGLHHPIAAVFLDDELPTHTYKLARRIAADPAHACAGFSDACDLRGIEATFRRDVMDEVAFFPTDRKGRPRKDCDNFGHVFCREGYMTMLSPSAWPRSVERNIPTFEMNIDDGWTKAPAGLSEHIDRSIDKKSGQNAVETLSPGQLESDDAAIVTAA